MFKILGKDDSVNTCDCCGKSNLKLTIIVEIDGEIQHYGSTCATRHTGQTAKEQAAALRAIDKEAERQLGERKVKAKRAYYATPEWKNLQAVMMEATKLRLIGVPYRDYTKAAREAANVVEKQICSEYDVPVQSM